MYFLSSVVSREADLRTIIIDLSIAGASFSKAVQSFLIFSIYWFAPALVISPVIFK